MGDADTSLPAGTVTLVFSDIEGSTRLLDELGERFADALIDHRRIVRDAVAAHGGVELRTEGDSFFVVFAGARQAVLATAEIQRELAGFAWPQGTPVRVRVGVHTGEPSIVDGDYVGMDVHRAARICSAAHGGQVLIGDATAVMLAGALPPGLELVDLGEHRLKDLSRPLRLHQLAGRGLQREFPPPRTLDARRTNLPAVASPLIGRERELADVRRLLGADGARLVTLTGPGGAGKTRLALAAAGDLSDLFPGGTYAAFLAGVGSGDQIVPAVAAALGVRKEAGRELRSSVVDALAGSARLLLLLDNLEHILHAAAAVVSGLLGDLPELSVLTTSRAPLRLSAERELDVSGLPMPDAARLFAERAGAVPAGFALDDGAGAVVEQICARLDGLPLAIELAAARVRVLPLPALLRRLDRGLDLLVGGARDLPERQRTLRATIAWSHDLLDASQRDLLHRLAIFAGGFPLDLAAAVAADGNDVVDGVTALVENSLLRAIAPVAGEPRFLMLETIRAFALERLALEGRQGEVADVHAEAVVAFAERAREDMLLGHQPDSLDRLDAELDNIRAAVEHIRATRRGDLELRLAAAIGEYALQRGRWSEGRAWVEGAIEHGSTGAPVAYARSLGMASWLARWDGDGRRSEELAQQLLAFADEHGDRRARGVGLIGMGLAASADHGDPERAARLFGEAAELNRDTGDEWVLAIALNNLGDSAIVRHDFAAALEPLRESLAIGERRGHRDRIAMARGNLATALLGLGELEAARAELAECLRVGREIGHVEPVLFGATTLAALLDAEGDAEGAARAVGTAEAAFTQRNREIDMYEGERHEELVASLRKRLGERRFEALRAQGAAVALDELIETVLERARPEAG